MEKDFVNLWEDCKDCDTIEGVKTQLSKVLVNRTGLFYDKPHYTSKEACKYLKISKKTLDNLCDLNIEDWSDPNLFNIDYRDLFCEPYPSCIPDTIATLDTNNCVQYVSLWNNYYIINYKRLIHL